MMKPSTLPLRYLLSDLLSWEPKRNALRAIARKFFPSVGPSEATLQLPTFICCFLNTPTQEANTPVLFSTRDTDWLPLSSHWLLRPRYGKSVAIRSVPLQAVRCYWHKFLEDTSQTILPPLRLPAEIILTSVWKPFWALPLPQAVITPWWRLLHNSIGVASKVFRWNLISFPSPLCRFCTEVEDTFHFVVVYPTNWLLWSAALAEMNLASCFKTSENQVDATQTITAFTKGADRLWTADRAATDIYQGFHHDIENGGSEEICHILEKIRRLAVYSLGKGKELGKDDKDLAIKALKQPESLKHLEDEDGKDYFFSPVIVEKIQQAGFELPLREQPNQNFGASIRMKAQGEEESSMEIKNLFLAEAEAGVCIDHKPPQRISHFCSNITKLVVLPALPSL
ncbi:hypothetical protein G6F37_004082 [Rhizopus arrhizus]|nr:hypothetical protein G6F38_003150 [Rhizopus arrhizus]KAG1160333.1 hypothetical protein G6F37_004082 [Rhizopus arrhizus]